MTVGASFELKFEKMAKASAAVGKEIKAELKEVQVNEKFNFNLISVTRMLQKGCTLKGDAKSITLEKGNHAFVFDSVIWTRGGALYCARFCRNKNSPLQDCDMASVASDMSEETTTKSKEAMKKISKSMSSGLMNILGIFEQRHDQVDSIVFGHEPFAWNITCLQIVCNCKGETKERAKGDIWGK